MAGGKSSSVGVPGADEVAWDAEEEAPEAEELGSETELICRLTKEPRKITPEEETLQAMIDQLHREYHVPHEHMDRDVAFSWTPDAAGQARKTSKRVALVVYEGPKPEGGWRPAQAIRLVWIAKKGTKPEDKKAGVPALEGLLNTELFDGRSEIFGAWTNGDAIDFVQVADTGAGQRQIHRLADFPAPDETVEDLDTATRRPLRVATKESLLRAFKSAHDYLYGNQSMRTDKAFWQLLNLIFCKIHDEQSSRRDFFVGAREPNTPDGQATIARRIGALFERTKDAYRDVFDGTERIELNERALAYVATQLSRYSLLGTDADAKGMAYEAITSNTLKRERGQFFTPRNVIAMMVEMMDPGPDERVLDPACGSGGFLVVVLNHVRKRLLEKAGCPMLDHPVPIELKLIERDLKAYAQHNLWGIDVDADLRKAARMNMVMNNDGHAHVYNFNSLEFGVPGLETDEMGRFVASVGLSDAWMRRSPDKVEFGAFDFVFTNPPFGAKIPITDPRVLAAYDLGHKGEVEGHVWRRSVLHKRVPPEILFIEACARFLKPGTGKLAIVLPDGILGNPGGDMASVRAWILQEFELLASVDLPAEAFLPQVAVQASCVFLRRRHPDELKLRAGVPPEQQPVFMAIAEKVGHGRRGETVVERGPDGREIIRETEEILRWQDRDGTIKELPERRPAPVLADDLPWIATQYRKHVNGKSFEAE